MTWVHKNLLTLSCLKREEIYYLFSVAERFWEVLHSPTRKVAILNHKVIAQLFFESSTRTRLSFELAGKRLGAEVLNFSGKGSSLEKGETLLDTVENILAMGVDMLVIRHGAPGSLHFLARHVSVPLINAGDGTHQHPTQALLDGFTLWRQLGKLEGLRLGIVGDILHSRVALSHYHLAQKLGISLAFCGPPGLIPAPLTETEIPIYYDLKDLYPRVDVIMVLRMQVERQKQNYISGLEEYVRHYQVRADDLPSSIKILHPGPIHRGVEIDSRLADSSQSLILQQVAHGVALRMAVLYSIAQATFSVAAV
ncbi:MAG: aspartate carbamoyltransferase catalytic subunit [Bacteroidia bacterium]